jgi:hypothetical protein
MEHSSNRQHTLRPRLLVDEGQSRGFLDGGAPFTVLQKVRHGDRDMEISVRDINEIESRAPVFVGDIIDLSAAKGDSRY